MLRYMAHCRWLATAMLGAVVLLITSPLGHADPTPDPSASPYPNGSLIRQVYQPIDADQFIVDGQPGIWFLTPTGVTCAIWYRGSVGCTGDIPGAPPGATHIAWKNGDKYVHYDWTAAIWFPGGHAIQTLQPRSYVESEGTTCAVMADTSTYCRHGPFQFYMTASGTWLNP